MVYHTYGIVSQPFPASRLYTSKTDLVTALLREMILSGELFGSQAIRQRDIAVQFGVSQTPVREALRRLESEGLVVSDPHRGATVAEAREGWLEENYQIRSALESLGARMAAKAITDEQLAELVALNWQMKAAGEDPKMYGQLNRDFHFKIYAVAGSPLLLALMRLLWNSMPTGPHVERSHEESVDQHRSLLEALSRHDGDAAEEVMRDHILGSVHLDPERRQGHP